MKNCTTPRTIADCEFTTGYGLADPSRWSWLDAIYAVALVSLCVLVGSLLVGSLLGGLRF